MSSYRSGQSQVIEKNEYPKATNTFVAGSLISYVGGLFLMMSFASPYWIVSYKETFSSFKNMGLWEYCFKDFMYPYYQFPRLFNGCHNIFGQEYYVIREYLLPGWLMAVQLFITLALIITFSSLGIMACQVCRYPLKMVLRYEWLFTATSFIGVASSAVLLFLGVLTFGVNAYRRDWLMYPKFNVLSWSYSFAVIAMFLLGLAALIFYKDAKTSYERRRESKNLVHQMQMHETASIPSTHSRGIHGYI